LVASQPLVSSTCGDPPAFLQKLFAATWLAAPVLAAPVVWEMVVLELSTAVQAGLSVCDEEENPAGSSVAIGR